jgi:hypothetical protein
VSARSERERDEREKDERTPTFGRPPLDSSAFEARHLQPRAQTDVIRTE